MESPPSCKPPRTAYTSEYGTTNRAEDKCSEPFKTYHRFPSRISLVCVIQSPEVLASLFKKYFYGFHEKTHDHVVEALKQCRQKYDFPFSMEMPQFCHTSSVSMMLFLAVLQSNPSSPLRFLLPLQGRTPTSFNKQSTNASESGIQGGRSWNRKGNDAKSKIKPGKTTTTLSGIARPRAVGKLHTQNLMSWTDH